MRSRLPLALVLVLLLALAASLALAAAAYDLSWWTVDAGGGASSGGPYVLQGTLGQPDAGTLSGGPYVLQGGFWGGAGATAGFGLYLPLILR